MFKLFKKTRKNFGKEVVSHNEPKFLNEYIVNVGNSSRLYVYARSSQEARDKVSAGITNNTPYYDSEYLRTCKKLSDARTPLHGSIKVFYNGVSKRRNPAYN